MNTIIIKTFLDDQPTYSVPARTITIKKPEGFIKRIIRKITNDPNKTEKQFNYAGKPEFNKITLKIIDEVDIEKWINDMYDQSKILEKATIKAFSKDGKVFNFMGCFPVKWNKIASEATFSIDHFIIEPPEPKGT